MATFQKPQGLAPGIDQWGQNRTSITAPGMAPSQGAYSSAVDQQAGDYDRLMKNYGDLYSQSQSNADRGKVAYKRTDDYGGAIGRAKNFADTGGYSSGDITAFRERGLSPIRSIYNTALNNLKRQRSLSGGYSPNFGALQAKMARDQSSQIGQHTMDLNANIAERVQQGKQFGLGQYGGMAQNEQGMINQTDQFNASNKNNYMQQALAANNAAANLYGTTPALVNQFGSNVLQSNQQKLAGQQAEANIKRNNLLDINPWYK